MWIIIEVIALLGLIAAIKFLGAIGLVLGVIFVIAVTLPNTARSLSKKRLVTRFYENAAYYNKKCTHCTGGAQLLHKNGEWGPIPVHVRMVRSTSRKFHPPQGNIRTCSQCRGMAQTPTKLRGVEDNGLSELPWPPADGVPYAADPVYRDEPKDN